MSRSLLLLAIVLTLGSLLAGCATTGNHGHGVEAPPPKVAPPPPPASPPPSPPPMVSQPPPTATPPGYCDIVPVFYATDRDKGNAGSYETYFSGERSKGLISYGRADVSIPKGHAPGEVERPTWWKLEFREDSRKHIVILSMTPAAEGEFFDALAASVGASSEKSALVFIHGYNVTFADALRRTAQIAHDISYDGVPVLYSWPSRGGMASYPADEASVEWTTPHLEQFLADLAARSGATSIDLVAHSMGNRALGRAFADLATRREPQVARLFKDVVLTAPDIDADVFKDQIVPKLVGAGVRVTLYVSTKDKALLASKRFHKAPRAGEQVRIFAGVDTIDASGVDMGFLGHSYFTETVPVIADLYGLLRLGLAPATRRSIAEVATAEGKYWKLKP